MEWGLDLSTLKLILPITRYLTGFYCRQSYVLMIYHMLDRTNLTLSEFSQDCWNEVLRKRRNRQHLWRQGSKYLDRGDDATQEVVVKEVSSMRSVVDAAGKSKDARYRSGKCLDAERLTRGHISSFVIY